MRLRKPKIQEFEKKRFRLIRNAKKFISKLSIFPTSRPFSNPPAVNNAITRRDYFNPIQWLKWINRFIVAWFWTRPYASIAPGLPALILSLGLFLIALQTSNNQWKSNRYKSILQSAHSSGQFQLAKLALNRLIEISPSQRLKIQLALIEEQQGNLAVAATMMQGLVQHYQNPEAALWLLMKAFNFDEFGTWSEQQRTNFQSLVAVAITGSDETAKNARLLYVSFLLRTQSKMEAARVLELVAAQDTNYLLAAAKLNQDANPAASQRLAETAAVHFRSKLDSLPNDISATISLAQALVILSREEEAVRLLTGASGWSADVRLSQGAAEALALYALRLKQNDSTRNGESLAKRLDAIKRAVDLAPNHAMVIDVLTQILIECRESANQELLVVRRSLLNGLAPETMHFIEGTIALLNDDVATAESHFAFVGTDTDKMPGLLNNVAVVLQRKGAGNLPRALEFSNAALSLLPDNAVLRETRGEILASLGRHREAVADLEFSLRDASVAAEAHTALANSYAELGMVELSNEHRKLSQTTVK